MSVERRLLIVCAIVGALAALAYFDNEAQKHADFEQAYRMCREEMHEDDFTCVKVANRLRDLAEDYRHGEH